MSAGRAALLSALLVLLLERGIAFLQRPGPHATAPGVRGWRRSSVERRAGANGTEASFALAFSSEVRNTYEALDSKTERALDRFTAALNEFQKEQAQQLNEFKKEEAQQLGKLQLEMEKSKAASEKLQLEIEKSKAASETLAKVGAVVVAVSGIVIPLFGDAIKDGLKGIGLPL